MLDHDKITEISDASQDTAEALRPFSKLFAEAFAVYTVEVLSRLEGVGKSPLSDALAKSSRPPSGSNLDDAPDWVRASYDAMKRNPSPGVTVDQIRPQLIRNQLIAALHKKRWSQADLARHMKKSPAAISRAFREPERCRLKTLSGIASALDVDVSSLL